ncbi:hypothetical protein AGOR_G00139810 [Albula goreensis]|uniref:Uncharacterized protein n=1 Tax=Albula goreensis TaxID=1534307 RepID=A0A8T3DAE0_9TELE|nr:hypothetical protein AGOR_G00139810 [Albula goreensis]
MLKLRQKTYNLQHFRGHDKLNFLLWLSRNVGYVYCNIVLPWEQTIKLNDKYLLVMTTTVHVLFLFEFQFRKQQDKTLPKAPAQKECNYRWDGHCVFLLCSCRVRCRSRRFSDSNSTSSARPLSFASNMYARMLSICWSSSSSSMMSSSGGSPSSSKGLVEGLPAIVSLELSLKGFPSSSSSSKGLLPPATTSCPAVPSSSSSSKGLYSFLPLATSF